MKLAVIDMLLLLEAIARFPIIGRLKSCSLADDTDALKFSVLLDLAADQFTQKLLWIGIWIWLILT